MMIHYMYPRSEGVSCSICMEMVLSKNPPSEQRFGILSESCDPVMCSHDLVHHSGL